MSYSRSYRSKPEVQARIKSYRRQPEIQERDKAYRKAYSQQPEMQERHRVYEHFRRARNKSIKGVHTPLQIQDQLRRQKHKCYYCRMRFKKAKGKCIYHIEHTFPLSRIAGTDIPANCIDYLVLACPTCNQNKNNKFPWEYPEGGRLI
jgi:CRISPR/Cas system Type II protein with McrA/HNH and RuvC-like nuclease domain